MPNNPVSVILLNYARPHNMDRVIGSIKMQTIETEIIMVDNSNDRYMYGLADKLITPSKNLGCFIRLLMAHYASHQYILLMDDDLVITDKNLLKDTIELYQHQCSISQGGIMGAYGRMVDFTSDKPYSGQKDIIMGKANAIKGRFMFFHKSILDRVPIGSGSHPYDPFNEDLYFSFMAGQGKPVHYVSEYISTRLQDLDSAGALCSEVNHMDKRDAMCRWFAERRDTEFIREIM